jgi:hydroxyethylthiazole kinase
VTANECANALLAVGAAPVMSLDRDDAADLARVASAVVLNIGTLNPAFMEVALAAGRTARERGIPLVLDPVGAGATRARLEAAGALLSETKPTIIRGNLAEILALLPGAVGAQKGVDSDAAHSPENREKCARLSRERGAVVAVTGPVDLVAQGEKTAEIPGGSPLLTRLTGTGCLLSALVGAYAAVAPEDPFGAAQAAMRHLKKAGEAAASLLSAPENLGEFRVRLFDALATLR